MMSACGCSPQKMRVNLLNLLSEVKWAPANRTREASTAPIIYTLSVVLMLAWSGSNLFIFFEVVQANRTAIVILFTF